MSAMSDLYTRALLQLESEREDWETLPLNEQNALVAGRAQEIADAIERAMSTTRVSDVRPDRRRLDPAIRAEVFHHDGLFQVRAGGALDAEPYDTARIRAYLHNSMNGHPLDPMFMRAGDRVAAGEVAR